MNIDIPRLNLGLFPTPIVKLEGLSTYLGGPTIWMKRDDLTGGASDFSGNKTRALEFVMADALQNGATHIVVEGATQSNNCRQASAAASKLGLGCSNIFKEHEPAEGWSGNVLLDDMHGANLTWVNDQTPADVLAETLDRLKTQGETPYHVPLGSSNEIGALGYYHFVPEVMKQEQAMGIKFDHLVHTCCSGGTQAGLLMGKEAFDWATPIQSAANDTHTYGMHLLDYVRSIVERGRDKYGLKNKNVLENDQILHLDYAKGGYGNTTERDINAMATFLATESMYIDAIYVCRSAAFLIDSAKNGTFKKDENILMLHTGGHPSIHSDRYRKDVYPKVAAKAREIRQEIRADMAQHLAANSNTENTQAA